MKKNNRAGLLTSVLIVTVMFASPVLANDDCPKFDNVVWWETSHEKIISYVSRKHDGDWSPYVNKWDGQLKKMKSLHERGGAAVFKSKNLRLEGDILLQYITAIEQRLNVTKCLARREMANAAEKNIKTANDG